jgi:site-specific DNA recombinase
MNFAILARLSSESRRRRHLRDNDTDDVTAKSDPKTGQDINNRDEQVNQCTAQIEARGGRVVHIYDEPHTSAWKRRKVTLEDGTVGWRVIRPVYKLSLSDLRNGAVSETGVRLDGVMVSDSDRLTRDNRDLEDAIDAVVYSYRPILDRRGALDLLTETGRTMARAIVAFKSGQSADTAARVKDKHVALQRAGIPTGGARPFGWMEDKRTLHPVESKLLRKAVKDALGGRSLYTIAADWNRQGILTARGKRWTRESLRTVLRNPRMAGYRMMTVHNVIDDTQTKTRHVVVARDANGEPIKGQWEAMISPNRWNDLIAIIGEAPGRGDGANTRTYLLTGTLRCGRCDTLMRAMKTPASQGKPEGHFTYCCLSKGAGGCGGISIDGSKTDEAVATLTILKYEDEAKRREATAAPRLWAGQAELDAVHEDMAAAKATRKAGRISAERYYNDLAELEADERRLLKERNAHLKATTATASAPATLRHEWLVTKTLTLTEKRTYIERAFSAVIVAPVGKGRRVPPIDRLTPMPAS